MEYINYGKKRIEYSIKRGKRKKTLAINVTQSAHVIVLVPNNYDKENISKIIKKKARWIIEKQEYFNRLSMLFPEKEFISGEQILFLGRKYRLKIKEEQNKCLSIPKLIGRRIFVSISQNLDPIEKKKIIKDSLIK